MFSVRLSIAALLAVGLGLTITPAVADRIEGGPRDNRLIGTNGRDLILGFKGDDDLYGRGGRDRLFGGPGYDRLYGGPRADYLWGAEGVDDLYGGPGRDELSAAGIDTLKGGPGDDTLKAGITAGTTTALYGGPGNDKLNMKKQVTTTFAYADDGQYDVITCSPQGLDGVDADRRDFIKNPTACQSISIADHRIK
jgi:Ca2+-binding RTX toxin-like protein